MNLRLILITLSACYGCTDLSVLDQTDPLAPLPTSNTAQRWQHPQLTGTTTLDSNHLQLHATVPPQVLDCEREWSQDEAACRDLDQDGLSDLWERIALHRLRPFVRMHHQEPLFSDYYGRVVASGRVTQSADTHIRVFVSVAFSNDYGRCGATAHRGDPERIAMDLVQRDSHTVEVVRVYTASHEGTALDGSLLVDEHDFGQLEFKIDELADMPRWVVYSSIGKHAMYPSADACAAKGGFVCLNDDCASEGDARNDLLPDVYNIGEPDSQSFEFEGSENGVEFREATPKLRREQVWGDEDYCGDIPEHAVDSYSGSCAGPMRDKFVRDPFL